MFYRKHFKGIASDDFVGSVFVSGLKGEGCDVSVEFKQCPSKNFGN